MRDLVWIGVLVLAGCAGTAGGPDGRPLGGGPLPENVFPYSAPEATFATPDGGIVMVRVEPTETGARMWIAGDFPQPRRIDWRREGDDLIASDGPDRGVTLLRIGVLPGATWESSGQRIVFDGWERVETPAGVYDAVRVRTAAGPPDLTVSETWWFAPDEGLIRYRQDRAGLFQLEMSRVR